MVQIPDVTIVGAGIAGMTAALRLLEAGFSVKVIEASAGLGGKFGAVYAKERYHDFAWHIFADWCLNFWAVVDAIGLDRRRDFAARPTLTILRPRGRSSRWPRAASVSHVGVPEYFWRNANSGVAHWSDLLLFTYSLYTLLCDESLEREEFLNRTTVNGYMRSLPHMSDVAALLHNELLLRVWAIPSYLISARSYQTHLQLVAPFNDRDAPIVVMRENFAEAFWRPFRRKLESFGPRFTLVSNTRLRAIRLAREARRAESIVVQPSAGGPRAVEPVRELIVAIPPSALVEVLADPDSLALRQDQPGLLDLAKLPSQQTSTLSLRLKRPLTLAGVGDEPLAFFDDFEDLYAPDTLAPSNGLGSEYGLSLIDVGILRGERRGTSYSVLASDAEALGPLDDDEACQRVMRVLQTYLPFEDQDVDWTSTQFLGHRQERLFVNAVGTWEYRPEVRLRNSSGDALGGQLWRSVRNLYLAGDYCRSRIDVVSLEGAIHTALWAAHALSTRVRAETGSRGPTVAEPTPPEGWPEALPEARRVLSRLERWVGLAGRRSHAVAREIQAAARQATPHAPEPLVPSGPTTTHSRSDPDGNGGPTMTESLSAHPGLLSPPDSAVGASWTDKARGGDLMPVTLKSGATVSVPVLLWEAQALILHGTVDGDAIDAVLGHEGLRAVRKADAPNQAGVAIWAPDYGGSSLGPLKGVFAVIQVEPRRDCRGPHRLLPHYWWWWYFSNSVVNHEFKRDVWGVPHELAAVETAYRADTKSVRLLEKGRLALRLHMAARRNLGRSIVPSQPGPGLPHPVYTASHADPQAAADETLKELSELLTKHAEAKQAADANDDAAARRVQRAAIREAAFRYVSVGRRAHDDGENEVSYIGSRFAEGGPGKGSSLTFDESWGDRCEWGPGTALDKRMDDVGFKPERWNFYTTYNGVVWIYDGRGRGKEDRREEIEQDLGRRLIDKLDLRLKDY